MALVVEDGTGLTNANAFIFAVEAGSNPAWIISAQSYWADRGRATSVGTSFTVGATTYSVEQVEAAIVRATSYLSESFQYRGIRTYGRNSTADGADHFQALAWPRFGVYDREGAYVPSSGEESVPREIQWATAEAAFYELENPNGLAPVYDHNRIIQEVKAGSASVSYDTSRVNASGARPRVVVLADLIGEFLASGSGSSLVGTAVRG